MPGLPRADGRTVRAHLVHVAPLDPDVLRPRLVVPRLHRDRLLNRHGLLHHNGLLLHDDRGRRDHRGRRDDHGRRGRVRGIVDGGGQQAGAEDARADREARPAMVVVVVAVFSFVMNVWIVVIMMLLLILVVLLMVVPEV